MKKPFYLALVVWGERHRNYMLDYCFPSLLAPNNVPSLKLGKRNKIIVCTTNIDQPYIENSHIVQALSHYISFEYREISPPPPNLSGCQYMSVGHKIVTQMMWEDGVHGSVITPDQIFSNGSLAFLQQKVEEGYDIILTPACMRVRTDYFFQGLVDKQAIPSPNDLAVKGAPLIINNR